MKILVIGSGGREHALCWAIAASPLCDKLYCAPGNGGIRQVAECVAIDVMDFDGIVAFAREHGHRFRRDRAGQSVGGWACRPVGVGGDQAFRAVEGGRRA